MFEVIDLIKGKNGNYVIIQDTFTMNGYDYTTYIVKQNNKEIYRNENLSTVKKEIEKMERTK